MEDAIITAILAGGGALVALFTLVVGFIFA